MSTPLPGSSRDEMFPVLTAAQQARVLAHGTVRKVMPGETLVELNQQPTKIFVVVQGRLELFQLNDRNEEIVAVCGPGMFTGELNVLSGRRALVSIRAAEAGELIEIEREALRTLVQTDSQLSDIFLRAFILRRLELIARDVGDIVLIGATTENPSFEVNAALLSRSKVFVLQPLDAAGIEQILRRALTDPERGLGSMEIQVSDDAVAAIAQVEARRHGHDRVRDALPQNRRARRRSDRGSDEVRDVRHLGEPRVPRHDAFGVPQVGVVLQPLPRLAMHGTERVVDEVRRAREDRVAPRGTGTRRAASSRSRSRARPA